MPDAAIAGGGRAEPREGWSELIAALRSLREAVVTTHVNPDGDAIGCEIVLTEALRSLGCTAHAVMTSSTPAAYAFLDDEGVIERYDPSRHEGIVAKLPLVIVDTSSIDRLARMKAAAARAPARYVLDHHREDGGSFDAAVIDPSAPACAELLIRALDDLGVPITERWARMLYVAILTDTGGFRFTNTDARAHIAAGRLLREFPSIHPATLFARMYESYSARRMRVLGRALSGLEVECGGRLAHMTITRAMIDAEQVDTPELEGVVDSLRTIDGVQLALLFVEPGERVTKVSVRSREPVDAAAFASSFGGGGHARAAGIRLSEPLESGRRRTLEAARSLFGAPRGD